MFILKKGHQPGIYVPLRALFLVILKPRGAFDSNFAYLYFLATGMQNGDEASPNIISGGRPLLVKMVITLEPQGIFRSNFVYLCMLTLYDPWYAKR